MAYYEEPNFSFGRHVLFRNKRDILFKVSANALSFLFYYKENTAKKKNTQNRSRWFTKLLDDIMRKIPESLKNSLIFLKILIERR